MRPFATSLFVIWISACGGAATAPAAFEPPPDAGATPLPPMTCERARVTVDQAVFSIVAEHGSGCLTDSACTLVSTSLPCLQGCENAVVAAETGSFQDELQHDGVAICTSLVETCSAAPSCPPVAARCVNGACRPVPIAQP